MDFAAAVQTGIDFSVSQPFITFFIAIAAAILWYAFDKGQVETISLFGYRRIAIPALIAIVAAGNLILQTQGLEGITLSVADALFTGVVVGVVFVAIGVRN